MKITTIPTGFFKLDGGAMFGIVPKRLWQKLNPPDENNLCTWSMRCLLIETGDSKILVDTGFGEKQDAKFRSFFEPHGSDSLLGSLRKQAIFAEDITDVFLTHLHFDHCGGAVKFDEKGALVPTFPNATYWSNEVHWQWAMDPNERERASFLKENFVPLKEAGVLRFIDVQKGRADWLPGLQVQFVYGHTEAMMLLHINYYDRHLVYCADLLPSAFHIGMPYVMAYDVRPLVTLQEKEDLLADAVCENWVLFFEHDPVTSCATVQRSESGRIVLKEQFELDKLANAA
jgi:glyoxylase-like metal-dependent hydrolase (beta-lactamase superfamily II)